MKPILILLFLGGIIMKHITIREAEKMCNDNYDFFKDNIDELCKKYFDKYIVIKDKSIIAVYDSFDDAYEKTSKKETLGTFLIQRCRNDDTVINQFYSNNVVFA